MDETRHIDRPDQLKALSDANRMAVLRLIMLGPATLTQVGTTLHRHPAWVRHHMLKLERAGLVELAETRKTGGYVEKYYRATARAFTVSLMVLPQPSERGLIVVVGSDDLALELLATDLHDDPRAPDVFRLAMGSLEGLIALRQGLGHVAGCHLLDRETGEYNRPYAEHLFPGRALSLVTLAHREQGLLLPAGNPKDIRSLGDIAARGAMFVNRNQGSGTRVWIDRLFDAAGVDRGTVCGYGDEVLTHAEVARAVTDGRADAGVGIFAAARRFELDFVPLFEEQYDLVVPNEQRESELLEPLFERLNSTEFKRAVEGLGGYKTEHSGDEIAVAA